MLVGHSVEAELAALPVLHGHVVDMALLSKAPQFHHGQAALASDTVKSHNLGALRLLHGQW